MRQLVGREGRKGRRGPGGMTGGSWEEGKEETGRNVEGEGGGSLCCPKLYSGRGKIPVAYINTSDKKGKRHV